MVKQPKWCLVREPTKGGYPEVAWKMVLGVERSDFLPMASIFVAEMEIEVVKKKIKNMNLYVLPPDGRVRISAPIKASNESIRQFALSRMDWIRIQVSKIEARPRPAEVQCLTGEKHYLWGGRYHLELRFANRNSGVQAVGNRMLLTVPENSSREQREKILHEWYRRELKDRIPSLLAKWEPVMGVKADSWGVKNMKTRWGTCNPRDRRIWINLQLAKWPVKCLEYVVVHELAHLLVADHSAAFKDHMDRFLPDWRVTRTELNHFLQDPPDQ